MFWFCYLLFWCFDCFLFLLLCLDFWFVQFSYNFWCFDLCFVYLFLFGLFWLLIFWFVIFALGWFIYLTFDGLPDLEYVLRWLLCFGLFCFLFLRFLFAFVFGLFAFGFGCLFWCLLLFIVFGLLRCWLFYGCFVVNVVFV